MSLSLYLAISLSLSSRGALNFLPLFARMVQKKEEKKDKKTQLRVVAEPSWFCVCTVFCLAGISLRSIICTFARFHLLKILNIFVSWALGPQINPIADWVISASRVFWLCSDFVWSFYNQALNLADIYEETNLSVARVSLV
jgi:hypothetical protein